MNVLKLIKELEKLSLHHEISAEKYRQKGNDYKRVEEIAKREAYDNAILIVKQFERS